jgi:hypothetical protein
MQQAPTMLGPRIYQYATQFPIHQFLVFLRITFAHSKMRLMHSPKHMDLGLYDIMVIRPIRNEPLEHMCFAMIDTNIPNQAKVLIFANDRPGKQAVTGKC